MRNIITIPDSKGQLYRVVAGRAIAVRSDPNDWEKFRGPSRKVSFWNWLGWFF